MAFVALAEKNKTETLDLVVNYRGKQQTNDNNNGIPADLDMYMNVRIFEIIRYLDFFFLLGEKLEYGGH